MRPDTLFLLNEIFLGIFIVEILIRLSAYGSRPQDYFKDRWNVFDFIVVFAVFIPGVRENATLLRLVRLLRVVRVISVLPDLRVLISGMGKAMKIAVMGAGAVGCTLEGWNEILFRAQEVTQFAWVFLVSFVLLASFLVINILIAVIINSVEEAREEERAEEIINRIHLTEIGAIDQDPVASLIDRVGEMKRGLTEIEVELATLGRTGSGGAGHLRSEPESSDT